MKPVNGNYSLSASATALVLAMTFMCTRPLVAQSKPPLSPQTKAANHAFTAEENVSGMLRSYGDMLRGMKFLEMSRLFADSGAIVNPGQPSIVGPKAIRKFLEGFATYRITEYRLDVDTVNVLGDSATANAHFTQIVIVPVGDTLHVVGKIHSRWTRDSQGHWKIQEMASSQN